MTALFPFATIRVVISQISDTDVEPARAIEAADVPAEEAAREAARRAGVEVCPLQDIDTLQQADHLFTQVWGGDRQEAVSVNMMKAMAHTGNYVSGAWQDGRLVGASVAFAWENTERPALHSHITGVSAVVQSKGIGVALKLHQKAWALQRGISEITWTFDPLIRRNAWFNLMKLGAQAASYHPDFYGPLEDEINADDESDRCLAVWDLHAASSPSLTDMSAAVTLLVDDGSARPHVTTAGESPVDPAATLLLCQIPADTESLRRDDPPLGRRWRAALRQTMGAAMDAGFIATGITRNGAYVLQRKPS